MNWLEFFFGWLIKGQAEVTVLDEIMYYIELLILFFIWVMIFVKKNKR